MKRLAATGLWMGMAVLGLAACASVEKGVDSVRELANYRAEQVTYPSITDIPAKPTPPGTPAEHKEAVQSLEADRDAANAQAADLRTGAANMQLIPVPGQPEQATPAQPDTTTP